MAMALLAAAATLGCAQSSSAPTASDPVAPSPTAPALHGVVMSTGGVVYEGARVVLEVAGNPAAAADSDENGAFRFANLAPGDFKLTVTSRGFVTQTISGVLRAGEDFDAGTIALPLIAATNEVTVSGGSQAEIAQEQLNLEEKQRVLGVFPNYYVSYDPHSEPLTARQKFQLAWRTALDPVTWVMTASVAGIEQSTHTFAGYGQGAQGYGKRFGANYADGFTGTMIGGAMLPALLHQDPRYFYKGTGSTPSRAFYAIANAVICKGDNGRWQPNYSGILGGVAAGGISNLYYPASNRSGLQLTISNTLIGTAESAMQNLAQEFLVRRLTPRLPRFPSVAGQ